MSIPITQSLLTPSGEMDTQAVLGHQATAHNTPIKPTFTARAEHQRMLDSNQNSLNITSNDLSMSMSSHM